MPFKIKMKRVCNMRYGKEKMILKRMSHLEFYEKIKKKRTLQRAVTFSLLMVSHKVDKNNGCSSSSRKKHQLASNAIQNDRT